MECISQSFSYTRSIDEEIQHSAYSKQYYILENLLRESYVVFLSQKKE